MRAGWLPPFVLLMRRLRKRRPLIAGLRWAARRHWSAPTAHPNGSPHRPPIATTRCSVVCAPPALKMLGEKYPGLKIYTAMIDTELDARGWVLPLVLYEHRRRMR